MQVVVTQASKAIQDAGINWNPNFQIAGGESMFRMESLTLGPAVMRSPTPAKGRKVNNKSRLKVASVDGNP